MYDRELDSKEISAAAPRSFRKAYTKSSEIAKAKQSEKFVVCLKFFASGTEATASGGNVRPARGRKFSVMANAVEAGSQHHNL